MKAEGKLYHVGINLLTVPGLDLSRSKSLEFQRAVLENGLEYSKVDNQENGITLIREAPSLLQIVVANQQALVNQLLISQLLIVAPKPVMDITAFVKEAEAATKAFETVWPAQQRQIVGGDANIRRLYESTSAHAFQELWETRLRQPPGDLRILDKPIRGGGIRIVLDPRAEDIDPVSIEVKIESFLEDPSKLFVETQCTWLKPAAWKSSAIVTERIMSLNDYFENQVHGFMTGAAHDKKQ
jgi:hypothetical protein